MLTISIKYTDQQILVYLIQIYHKIKVHRRIYQNHGNLVLLSSKYLDSKSQLQLFTYHLFAYLYPPPSRVLQALFLQTLS